MSVSDKYVRTDTKSRSKHHKNRSLCNYILLHSTIYVCVSFIFIFGAKYVSIVYAFSLMFLVPKIVPLVRTYVQLQRAVPKITHKHTQYYLCICVSFYLHLEPRVYAFILCKIHAHIPQSIKKSYSS